MKRRRNDEYSLSSVAMLNEIDPGIDLGDSYRRMKENEAYVQTLIGTPTHIMYDIISSHEHWYVEGGNDKLSIELPTTDDRMLELGFIFDRGTYNATGPGIYRTVLDIYRLRNHYHTRGMFLLPSDPYDGRTFLAVKNEYGYIH